MTVAAKKLSNRLDLSLIFLRPSIEADRGFVDHLTRDVMAPYVAQTWSDKQDIEAYFKSNKFDLPSTQIIQYDSQDIGRLSILWREDHLYIDNLHILSEHQGKGIGKFVIQQLIQQADLRDLSIKLMVLKINPAKKLYEALGFKIYTIKNHRFLMERNPLSIHGNK